MNRPQFQPEQAKTIAGAFAAEKVEYVFDVEEELQLSKDYLDWCKLLSEKSTEVSEL